MAESPCFPAVRYDDDLSFLFHCRQIWLSYSFPAFPMTDCTMVNSADSSADRFDVGLNFPFSPPSDPTIVDSPFPSLPAPREKLSPTTTPMTTPRKRRSSRKQPKRRCHINLTITPLRWRTCHPLTRTWRSMTYLKWTFYAPWLRTKLGTEQRDRNCGKIDEN